MLHSRSGLAFVTLFCGLLLLAACDTAPTPTPTPTLPTAATPQALSPTNQPTLTHVVAKPAPAATGTAWLQAISALPSIQQHSSIATSGAAVTTKAPAASATAAPVKPRMEVLASGFGSPDDLVVAPSGDILFGDFGNNAINVLRPGGKPTPLAKGLSEPEGMVVTADGVIVVAEQATNRLLEIDPRTGSKKLLRQLENKTHKDGVDGLGLDPATGDILVPDSPNGRLLRVSRDGKRLQVIATGFVRPTGMAVEPGGSMVVADEFGNAVYRLGANGKRTLLARIYQPDDVVVDTKGNIYANSLNGNIVRINPVSGKITTLISGLKLPHGLGLDPRGNVIVAEAGRNRILRLPVRSQP